MNCATIVPRIIMLGYWFMKKILGIIVLSLLWSSASFAGKCNDDLDKELTWTTDKKSIQWSIKNTSNREITITKLGVWASDNKTTMKVDKRGYLIKPYGVKKIKVWFGDVNLDVRGGFFSACKYGKKVAKTYTPPPIERCSETDYDTPCTCERESNAATKKYCELRKENANKTTRSEAAGYCARRAEEYSKEVGAEYYKDCMKDEGF